MPKKLNLIVLIDDDEATNYLNKRVIDSLGCAETVIAMQNGNKALDFLKTKVDGEYPCPDIIFLDINMPTMDGWEFLESYKQLNEAQKAEIVVFMLSTSLNPDDKDKANEIEEVNGLINKPLLENELEQVLETYFN